MSKTLPMVTGHITNAIGPYGDNIVVDDILNDNVTHATLGLAPHQMDTELTALLAFLTRATISSGYSITDMSPIITPEEYTQFCTNIRERTTLSPYQIDMGH